MKKLLLLALLLIFSCSKDAGVAEPAPPVVVIPPTPQFDLVVSATEGGSVNPSGGTYDEDSSVTITATPIEGYEFTGWTGSNETSNVISITLSADITLTANFQLAETQFTATIIAGTGGIVSTPGGTLNEGTVLSITATAADGYEFTGWTGSNETSNVISITLSADITLTANFELIEVAETQFTATIIAGTGGIVSTPGGTLNEGTVLSITATATDGYEFTGWTGSNETSNVISITLSADITLTANFQLAETQFTATIIAGTGGIVSTPGGTLNEGTVLSITATAADGYEFTGWTGSNETSNVISITLSADITLTANFQLAETQFTATIIAGTGGIVSTPGGTLNEGTVLSITATAADGYEFTGWTGSNETSNVISITLSADITLTANFQLAETQFTATIIAGTGGIVSTPGGTLNEGTVLSITATAADGYEFTGWTGSNETSNVISITLSADITLTANFQIIQVATNYYSSGQLVANNNISEWFDRSLDVYGMKFLVAGAAGGQPAVSDEFAKKVAQFYKLLVNKDAPGINTTAQEKMIRIISGEIGFHQGFPTGQRIGYGNADQYTPNPLTDEGCYDYSGLCSLNDSMMLKDMIWYMSPDNSELSGDNVIVEVFEHLLHTIQSLGTRGAVDGSLSALNMNEEEDLSGTELFLAMKEAYENGVFDETKKGMRLVLIKI